MHLSRIYHLCIYLFFSSQVCIRHHAPISLDSSASSTPEALNDAATYKPCDEIIYVRDLGLGMTRGILELGRPFHGYYIPPDRRDFENVIEDEAEEKEEEYEVGGER